MGKYIDADRLRAVIEKERKNALNAYKSAGRAYDMGGADYLAEVLLIIEQLQKEQPEVDLEKASRNVYESWMGGTMNDVRRDMVELGKVLNARKEE